MSSPAQTGKLRPGKFMRCSQLRLVEEAWLSGWRSLRARSGWERKRLGPLLQTPQSLLLAHDPDRPLIHHVATPSQQTRNCGPILQVGISRLIASKWLAQAHSIKKKSVDLNPVLPLSRLLFFPCLIHFLLYQLFSL